MPGYGATARGLKSRAPLGILIRKATGPPSVRSRSRQPCGDRIMTPRDDTAMDAPPGEAPRESGPPADTGRWGRIPAWWLGHPAIDADGLAVLAALATYANARGECWPSQATLATALKRSRSTVNRILGHLAESGVIARESRRSASGGRLSCLYRLRLVPGDGAIPAAGVEEVRTRTPPVQPPAKDVAPTDSPCAPVRQEQPESEQTPDSHASRGPAQAVPDGWMPDAEARAWAEHRFAGVDLDRHAEGFRLRCQAHGYRYRDAVAAWKAWLTQDAAAGKAPLLRSSSRSASARSAATAPVPEQKLGAWMAAAAKLNATHGTTPQAHPNVWR
ncbi:helix-turn-helix domain-containing protein [Azospirillum brasilense]|nr:helix-turn-helix domain-containing protein [Azospirillum brasilense]NUB33524.1 helix-turn-helix domain-containing protein [Azospirillum brasilense]RIW06506.1 helix-turn-helix domain-containing protein [Azospirillum brasilense]